MESYDWDWEDDEDIPDYEEDDSFEILLRYLNFSEKTKTKQKS